MQPIFSPGQCGSETARVILADDSADVRQFTNCLAGPSPATALTVVSLQGPVGSSGGGGGQRWRINDEGWSRCSRRKWIIYIRWESGSRSGNHRGRGRTSFENAQRELLCKVLIPSDIGMQMVSSIILGRQLTRCRWIA